jgi:hypothetical protein
MDFSSHRDVEGIIKNVAYLGMVSETDKVLKLDINEIEGKLLN